MIFLPITLPLLKKFLTPCKNLLRGVIFFAKLQTMKFFRGEFVEKFTPTYNLDEFKNSDFKITQTAANSASELGFDENSVRKFVFQIERKHFYKSMTSYANHKIWQDVYHVPCGNLILYVKFTQNVISEFTLLSFKEK